MSDADTLKCARHPNVETNLKCGKCGTMICPKCMVETPVGARCPDCARLSKIPTYRVPSQYYLRATGAALGAGIVLGLVWGIIDSYLPFRFFSLLIAAGIGYVIGEAISYAVNRKRGTWLAVLGVIAVAVCFAMGYIVDYFRFDIVAYDALRIVFTLLSTAIGGYMAVSRLR